MGLVVQRPAVLGSIFMATVLAGEAVANERVVLAPHRAVYDLALDTSRPARNVDSARGRIVFDFSGDACDGYVLNFRQVTELQSTETGNRQIDVRTSNFEDGDGKQFRFKSQAILGGRANETTDGTANRTEQGYRVTITQPRRGTFEFGKDVLFPSEHLKRIIQAARRGETTLSVQMFDGSEEGRQVYDTLAVIGRRIAPGPISGTEDAARIPGMEQLARWPVTLSYFKAGQAEQTPSYAIQFELFENGVTRELRLDYREFRMTGRLSRLELAEASACPK